MAGSTGKLQPDRAEGLGIGPAEFFGGGRRYTALLGSDAFGHSMEPRESAVRTPRQPSFRATGSIGDEPGRSAFGGGWRAGSGAIWSLRSIKLRPAGWTSADAAGLPIFPGLVKFDEVASGRIDHALRFTASRTQSGFIHPATHEASSITDPNVPPMGLRVRLRADYPCGTLSFQPRVICVAMQEYGMLLADNGSNWYVSGAPDPRWDDD